VAALGVPVSWLASAWSWASSSRFGPFGLGPQVGAQFVTVGWNAWGVVCVSPQSGFSVAGQVDHSDVGQSVEHELHGERGEQEAEYLLGHQHPAGV
jgi:hypothetical protein